ncbi:MAG: hypothetical protein ACOX86_02680 [Pelotomaculaceae bacterium]|jgi:hypothetical protein|uniref:Uncharacterized protein n=1 Tax=anaerobic digester metagenome TaxID=1263854 RepID=A0A485M479_9ZZZZ|nr:hypothetical protein [Bacillota bacterium]HHU87307.1 hypothetical protein [Peptococcaceae bacterium]
MRKITVLIMTLLMSLTLSTAAFAGQVVKEITFYGNAQQGSIGDGTRGYSWYHSNANPADPVVIKKLINYSDRVAVKGITNHKGHPHHKKAKFISFYERNGDIYCHCPDHFYKNSSQQGEWFYYIDDNGVKHYFYMDPDLEYEWGHYKDKDGITQYYYVIKGWKTN